MELEWGHFWGHSTCHKSGIFFCNTLLGVRVGSSLQYTYLPKNPGWQEGEKGGERCTNGMHGRGRKAIDPRIPTMTGREHACFFYRPGRHWLAPSAKRREVFGGSHERLRSILLRTACEPDHRHLVRAFSHMDGGVELVDMEEHDKAPDS